MGSLCGEHQASHTGSLRSMGTSQDVTCVGTGHGGGSVARSALGLWRSHPQAALKVGSSAACAPTPGAALSTLGKPGLLRDGAGLGA